MPCVLCVDSGDGNACELAPGFGYLLVTTAVALLVFEKLGVRMLRKAWFNLDLVWAGTLTVTGLVTVLL